MKIFLAESNIKIKEKVKDYTQKESSAHVVNLITAPMNENRLRKEMKKSQPNLIILNLDNYKSSLSDLDKYISTEVFKYISVILTSSDKALFKKITTKVNCIEKSSYAVQNPPEIEKIEKLLKEKYTIYKKIKSKIRKIEKEIEKNKIESTTRKAVDKISKRDEKEYQNKYCEKQDTEEMDRIIKREKIFSSQKIIVIGSSIGGVEVLNKIITMLPANEKIAPIVITQHINTKFTKNLVNRLNNANPNIKVQIGENDLVLKNNNVYIAPGEMHMGVDKQGTKIVIKLYENKTMVSKHLPSINVLYRSVANMSSGKNVLAIILTGMGKDGVKGMGELYRSGAKTIAQDKNSCTVQGIAGECIVKGFISEELTIPQIIGNIINW